MFKLLKYLKPYTPQILLLLLFVCLGAFFDFSLVDRSARIVGLLGQADISHKMVIEGAWALLFAVLNSLCMAVISYLSSKISMLYSKNLRSRLFKKVEGFSLAEIDKISTASLITRTTTDITQISTSMVMLLRLSTLAPITMAVGIYKSFSANVPMTLVILSALPLLAALIVVVIIFVLPLFKQMQIKIDRLASVSREGLTGVRVIRAFNNDDIQRERFKKANLDLSLTAQKSNKILAIINPAATLLFTGLIVVLYWIAALNLDSSSFSGVFAVSQYSMRIMFAFLLFAQLFIILPQSSVSAQRVNEALDLEGTMVDGTMDANTPVNSLTFNNVSLRFDNAEEATLNNINFTVNKGETLAIIGGTGSGKSVLINLISRFYDVSSGEVLIDGINIKEFKQKQLRKLIGLVPQTALLFSGTVSQNIRWGKQDATDQEVQAACKAASAHDFISQMPEEYNSFISQGGTNLSGGQKQRLCIARALIRKPAIYIFDDSFSALDYKTDATIRGKLKQLTKDSITVIIGQRISTIKNSDKIIVLKDGMIAGLGTHNELLKGCDEYLQIAKTQFKEEELDL